MTDVGELIPPTHRPTSEPGRAVLVVRQGSESVHAFEVTERVITIGSDEDCAIRLAPAPGVAGEHARAWLRDGQQLILHHIASGYETLLDGKPIVWASIDPGDELAIGPYAIGVSRP